MQKIVSLTSLRISFVGPNEHPRTGKAIDNGRGAEYNNRSYAVGFNV